MTYIVDVYILGSISAVHVDNVKCFVFEIFFNSVIRIGFHHVSSNSRSMAYQAGTGIGQYARPGVVYDI